MKHKHKTELNKNALGLGESVVMGVAGTAPAFSVAATTATLIATVGVLSPASLLYCGLIMFGITIAFMQMNRVITNAGASYAWVGQIFHPVLGFFAGWALMVASVIFMVSGTIPAATATLTLIAPEYVNHTGVVTFVAAGWLLLVGAVIVKGIKHTSYTQVVMTTIELGVLVAVIVASFIQYTHQPLHAFSWRWFSLGEFTPTLFATGALTSLFFFWGWDVTLNLNEETRNGANSSGHGAIAAMIIVLLIFISFAISVLLVLSDAEIEQAGTNLLFVLAEKLFPHPWSYMAVFAVMFSTIGTLETSILQFTRTMYAKARDGALKPRYAKLHKNWQTPWVATSVIVGIGLALIFLSSFYSSIGLIIKDSINAIGFQVAFYYGLASFACVWHFRKRAMQGIGPFFVLCLWPAASASFLIFIVCYSIPTFNLITVLIGVGGIAVGVVPLLLNQWQQK